MKTREEILQHLLENGYTKKAINKITGFMIGKDLKGVDEIIKIKRGDGNFNDFINWYNNAMPKDVNPLDVMTTLCEDVECMLEASMLLCEDALVDRYANQLGLLLALKEKMENED